MDHEKAVQVKGLSVLHDFSSTKDGHVVCDEHGGAGCDCR